MSPATSLPRTYSRRSLSKRKRALEHANDTDESNSTASSTRKRSRPDLDKREAAAMDRRDTTPSPSKPKVMRTYGSSAKRRQLSPVPSPVFQSKSLTLARDLSEVFKSVTPTPSPNNSPAKLARRMLARAKTESSLEGSLSGGSGLERISSLPAMPSTPTRDKGKRKEVESEATLTPLLPLARPLSNVTRTYAGKSRSFLVAIPASSLGPNSAHLPPGMNLSVDEEEDDYLSRESYSSLRARWGVDNSEDDPSAAYPPEPSSKYQSKSATGTPAGSPSRKGSKKGSIPSIPLPNGMMNPLKSITELRSKGESRRFLDEVGYLFDGMSKDGSLSLRRTSALDIVTKLCDHEFAMKAKAADFLGRIWDAFVDAGAGRNEDKILDLLLAFLSALIARDRPSLADLAQKPSGSSNDEQLRDSKPHGSFVDIIFTLIASCTSSGTPDLLRLVEAGDVELKRAGLTKKDRGQLALIYSVITSKSCLFPQDTPITTPLLLTFTLQRIPSSLISCCHLPTLLTSLRVSLFPLVSLLAGDTSYPSARSSSKPISKAYDSPVSSHLSWRDHIPQIGFECLNAHLRLLDTYLLGQWQATRDDESADGKEGEHDDGLCADVGTTLERARDEWLPAALVGLGVCAEMKLRVHSSRKGNELPVGPARAGDCLETVLRVLVSFTHADENWSRAVLGDACPLSFVMRIVAWAGDNYHLQSNEGGRDARRGGGEIKGGDTDTETIISGYGGGDDEREQGSRDGSRDEEPISEEARWLDRLCLALGLLTNLVQTVDDAKDDVREIRLDGSCSLRKSACIQSCQCAQLIGGLHLLIRLYSQQEDTGHLSDRLDGTKSIPDSDAIGDDREARRDADSLFLRGHLAVLFGLLMRGSPKNEETIMAALPVKSKGEGRKMKLARLVEQAREFASFYALLTGSTGEMGGASLDRNEEDKVAREVVEYLEELRDAVRT
ncbi:hypothetical protein AX17_002201 [Amanita inopinata Kibby_2008]|nr:hypothetical protein AX17_002201 [Amanita inopinata Kibby_2008]